MSSVAEFMRAAEEADDAARDAGVRATDAKADYLELRDRLLLTCEETRAWARAEYADQNSQDARRAAMFTEDTLRSAERHVRVVLGLLVAAQSEQKHRGKQDGGDWDPLPPPPPPNPDVSSWDF